MDKGKNRLKICISCIILFLIIFILIVNAPLTSDDFWYTLIGRRGDILKSEINHYLTWSGRVVADITSSVLLNSPKIFRNFIQASIWVMLIFLLTYIPSFYNKKSRNINIQPRFFSFILIFILYWLSNPTIWQTSLWMVGFSNYVLPNFLILLYFCLLLTLNDKASLIKKYYYSL